MECLTQLKNGIILAGTLAFDLSYSSIYKFTDKGKVDTSVGNGTGVLEEKSFKTEVIAIIPISNIFNLAVTNTSIYAITSSGYVDCSVYKDGLIDNVTVSTRISSFIKLKDDSFLFGSLFKDIHKAKSDGKIDRSTGYADGKVEDKTLDGSVTSLIQLSNGTILAGTSIGSIYKLTAEGKIDTSFGDGTGKIVNQDFDGGAVNSMYQLANGTVLIGIGKKTNENLLGHIYSLNYWLI